MEISKNLTDFKYINIAYELGKENPDQVIGRAVGSIIVDSNGKIISSGTRQTWVLQEDPYIDITYHAEHMAIHKLFISDIINQIDINTLSLYTILEPCMKRKMYHQLPQPKSCTDIIIESGIKRVVFAIHEIHPEFSSYRKLTEHDVKVVRYNYDDSDKYNEVYNTIYNPNISKKEAIIMKQFKYI